MIVHNSYARIPIMVALTAALIVTPLSCKSKSRQGSAKGLLISTSLPLPLYVKEGLHKSADKTGRFFFPQLEIYDGSGVLIYSSHDSSENARIINDMPADIQSLRRDPNAVRLTEILNAVPDFKVRKQEILEKDRINVLSIFLENCHACSIQEDAFQYAQQKILANNINLLVIHVVRP